MSNTSTLQQERERERVREREITAMALQWGSPSHLLPPTTVSRMVREWLEEDCSSMDPAGFVVGDARHEASLLGKSAVRPCQDLTSLMHAPSPGPGSG